MPGVIKVIVCWLFLTMSWSLPAQESESVIYQQAQKNWQVCDQLSGTRAIYACLMNVENLYTENADYNYRLGLVALERGHLGVALNAFERVALLNPQHAGVWLDLAIVSYQMGDDASAQQFLEYLSTTYDLPPSIKEAYQFWISKVSLRQRSQEKGFSGDISFSLGRTSNANGGLSTDRIRLTGYDFPVELALDPAQRARSVWFGQTEANLYLLPTDLMGGSGHLVLRGVARQFQALSEYNQDTIELGLNWTKRYLSYNLQTGFSQLAYRLNQDNSLSIQRWRTQAQGLSYPCSPYGRLDLEIRHHSNSILNDRQLYLVGGMSCPWSDYQRVFAELGGGLNYPQRDRAGGQQSKYELAIGYGQRLFQVGQLELSYRYSHVQDQYGYSVLLENNSQKQLSLHDMNVMLIWPIARQHEVFGGVQYFKQASNIALFQIETKLAHAGWRYKF